MSRRYEELIGPLRDAYDRAVAARAAASNAPWKEEECARLLQTLQREGRTSLVEIGAGTGVHARFFADAGLHVVCADLSPAMVEHCRTRGLTAYEQDVLHLDLGRTFDAACAINSLLHVPREDLEAAFANVRNALVAGGLFWLGQYGGIAFDGVYAEDSYDPPRYFSWLTDEDLLDAAGRHFTIESFHTVAIDSHDGSHFQSLLLRRGSPRSVGLP